jgi:catechol 2,3-dioxygenase
MRQHGRTIANRRVSLGLAVVNGDAAGRRTEPAGGDLPAGTVMGAVTLRVADLEATEAFYREALGLAVRARGDGWTELGTARAPLVRLERGTDARVDPALPGLYHLALLLPARAALGAWLLHALESDVTLQGAADHAVSEAIYLADPEGNGIEVYRDRPRETWETRLGRISMTTEPLDVRDLTAAAAPRWDGVPGGTTVGHVHLQVGDLARSAAFYGNVLGFPRTNDAFPGACFLGAGGYHHHLGLNTWGVRGRGVQGRGLRSARAAGLRRFEVVVRGTDALDAAALRLRRARHAAERQADGTALDVRDPDGLEVRLRVERAPGVGDATTRTER